MKKLITTVACTAVFGVAGTASASIIMTDTTLFYDTYTEDDSSDLISYGGESATYIGGSLIDWVSWKHQFAFEPEVANILSATLTLSFYDDETDNEWFGTWEYAAGLGEDWSWDFGEIDTGSYSYNVNVDYLYDGSYQVTLGNIGCVLQDFYITKSELSIEYQPAPEPATMLLFGTGIAGLVGIIRRKKK